MLSLLPLLCSATFMLLSIFCTTSLRNLVNHHRRIISPTESRLFSIFQRKTLNNNRPLVKETKVMDNPSPDMQSRTLGFKKKSTGDEKGNGEETSVKKYRLNRWQRKARQQAKLSAENVESHPELEREKEVINLKPSAEPPSASTNAPITQKPRNPEKRKEVRETVSKKKNSRIERQPTAPQTESRQPVGKRELSLLESIGVDGSSSIPATPKDEMGCEPEVEELPPPPPLNIINTNHFTTVTFESLPISYNTKRALIEVMKYK